MIAFLYQTGVPALMRLSDSKETEAPDWLPWSHLSANLFITPCRSWLVSPSNKLYPIKHQLLLSRLPNHEVIASVAKPWYSNTVGESTALSWFSSFPALCSLLYSLLDLCDASHSGCVYSGKGQACACELDEFSISVGFVSFHTKTCKFKGAYVFESWLRPYWCALCDTDTYFVMPVRLYSLIWKLEAILRIPCQRNQMFWRGEVTVKNIICLVVSRGFFAVSLNLYCHKRQKCPTVL